MTPTIDYIRIKNSFAHKDTTIKFESGCNYIIGNYGSGKSELLELIGFAFFGVVALRGKSTTYPNLEVTLQFNYVNTKYKIIRTVKDGSIIVDNSIKANTTTGLNNFIINLLGYDYSIYTLSNYCQQGKLQYFSELTAAKRAQYIDKLNGIEDAKDFSNYLKAVRKDLKTSLEAHKSFLRPPEDVDIDLDMDYEEELKSLPETSDTITELTQQVKELSLSFTSVPSTPVMPSTSLLDLEDYDNIVSRFKEYISIEDNIFKLQKEIQDIRSQFSRKVISSSLNLESAKLDLLSSLKNSLVPVDLSCPSCSTSFNTSIFKSEHFVSQYTITELESIIQWLSPDIQDRLLSLNSDISVLEKSLKELDVEEYCDKYTTVDNLNRAYNKQKVDLEKYNSTLLSIKEINEHNTSIQNTIDEVNRNISESIALQKDTVDKQKYYLRCKSEKDVYLRMLSIYTKALVTSTDIQSKMDIIDLLLDRINSIVEDIQKESLPAISKTASIYLERLTRGVLHKIEVTDTYEIIVDGSPINVRSGAQKDLSSLAFRLSLGQSIVHGILPLFIGDEIDAASTPEVSAYIRKALQELSLDGTQIIIVTHKDTTNYDNCNIIDLG